MVTLLGSHRTVVVAALVLIENLPFGFWRAGLKKFSPRWFVAVHAPVPIAIGLRLLVGVGWRLSTLPLFVGSFFAGQLVGGRLRTGWRSRSVTSGSPANGAPDGNRIEEVYPEMGGRSVDVGKLLG